MHQFNDFIQELNLMDLPLKGTKFTWSSNQEHGVCSRLDRFLLSTEWLEWAPLLA